jgi:lipoprotein NlpI
MVLWGKTALPRFGDGLNSVKATTIKALLIAAIAIVAVCANAQTTSDDYNKRGLAKAMKGDSKGAIADLTHAIKLNPKDATAYELRGNLEFDKGHVDAAAADFNRALQLDPNLATAYTSRGRVKLSKYDFDGAISDFTRTIKSSPNLAGPYIGRGHAKYFKGDSEGARADYNQALRVNPQFASDAYYGLGCVNFMARKWQNALQDYKRYCELQKLDQEYARLFVWLVQSRLGHREQANRELAAYFKTANRDWTSKIAAYVLGSLAETELLAAASSATGTNTVAEQRCEALYFVGIKILLNGDKQGAADYFQKSLAIKRANVVEYQFAKSELRALDR